jgi:hypothetical protein
MCSSTAYDTPLANFNRRSLSTHSGRTRQIHEGGLGFNRVSGRHPVRVARAGAAGEPVAGRERASMHQAHQSEVLLAIYR